MERNGSCPEFINIAVCTLANLINNKSLEVRYVSKDVYVYINFVEGIVSAHTTTTLTETCNHYFTDTSIVFKR